MFNKLLALLGMGRRHHATRLTDSYENTDNYFSGVLMRDGAVVGTMINSYGAPSVLEGRIYRFLWLRLLIGRASGYPGYPNGAPYWKLSFITPNNSRGILVGRHGFVYIKTKREKLY
jgi:hypothetical protein